MNIDFNAAIEGGMNKEDFLRMMENQYAKAEAEYAAKEKARIEEEQAKKKAAAENSAKEALKAEGRAHLINALIAYSEAFDLLEEGETWDEEDVAKAEEAIKKFEEMVPMYIKLAEMQKDLDKRFGMGDIDPDSFFKGLF